MEERKNKISLATFILVLIAIIMMILGCIIYGIYFSKKATNNNVGKSGDGILNYELNNKEKSEKTINNGGNFVKYGDFIYYWKLNNTSKEETSLRANFEYNDDAINELVKRTANGEENVIFKGSGNGNIYILNGKIFISNKLNENIR